ncbi:MAG: preprotein translocase subunit SecE [Terracidiphilus sp.]|jgi:preprotein translocase subunit SecE
MALKAAIVNGEVRQPPAKRQGENPVSKISDNVVDKWKEFTRFLSDVRAEIRKVATPSRKEVETTTTVVIIAVFIFGLYFFVVDYICGHAMDALFRKLGG